MYRGAIFAGPAVLLLCFSCVVFVCIVPAFLAATTGRKDHGLCTGTVLVPVLCGYSVPVLYRYVQYSTQYCTRYVRQRGCCWGAYAHYRILRCMPKHLFVHYQYRYVPLRFFYCMLRSQSKVKVTNENSDWVARHARSCMICTA